MSSSSSHTRRPLGLSRITQGIVRNPDSASRFNSARTVQSSSQSAAHRQLVEARAANRARPVANNSSSSSSIPFFTVGVGRSRGPVQHRRDPATQLLIDSAHDRNWRRADLHIYRNRRAGIARFHNRPRIVGYDLLYPISDSQGFHRQILRTAQGDRRRREIEAGSTRYDSSRAGSLNPFTEGSLVRAYQNRPFPSYRPDLGGYNFNFRGYDRRNGRTAQQFALNCNFYHPGRNCWCRDCGNHFPYHIASPDSDSDTEQLGHSARYQDPTSD